ncbi:MAG: ABC transporter substrate-binding protein [Elusimicrobia bacterium]|nr:ABC transporter substrate-binding protein [Elusimicrobiota bacterium]
MNPIAAGLTLVLGSTLAAAAPTNIRIAYPENGTLISAQVGLTLGRTGLLRANGFAPELFALSTGRDMKLALVGGKVDVILTSEANFVVLLAEGFPAYGIASLGAGGDMGLAVRAGSGLGSIAQLRGKTIGTLFGTSLHRPALEWTRGVPEVRIVGMSSIGALLAALEAKKIDAALLWDPYMTDAAARGIVKVLRKEPLELIAVAAKSFVDRQPGALERLQGTLREAVLYFVRHKDEVNGWASGTTKLDASLIDRVSRTNRNYDKARLEQIDIRISPSFIAKMEMTGSFLYANKVISRNPDIGGSIRNPR